MAKSKIKKTQPCCELNPVQEKETEPAWKFPSWMKISIVSYLVFLVLAVVINFNSLFHMTAGVFSFLGFLQILGTITFGAAFVGLIFYSINRQEE